jgi:XTP/dITP diphosphohydrolase
MKVVLASRNAGKLREFQGAYAELGIEWISAAELNLPDIDEPYATFIENALHKARTVSALTGLPALADDSGLCVPALGGRPGVYSARFAGEPCNDEHNNQLLLEEMKDVDDRRAYYYAVLVLCESKDDPQPCIAEGCWWGHLLEQPVGTGGFGYDPLFWDEASGRSAAQLSLEEKQAKSHRGQALKRLEPILRQRFA